ncbi:unnamed protein product [Protopolystoma xenopodis]|uniref:Uncharacterized protein n=1 Tax=Protopolystoma xenopodis TaxID=117903 RepID=A0A3S5FE21_9PLAT|nr:unnamed protein product [Protopolystoma xenopodis]
MVTLCSGVHGRVDQLFTCQLDLVNSVLFIFSDDCSTCSSFVCSSLADADRSCNHNIFRTLFPLRRLVVSVCFPPFAVSLSLSLSLSPLLPLVTSASLSPRPEGQPSEAVRDHPSDKAQVTEDLSFVLPEAPQARPVRLGSHFVQTGRFARISLCSPVPAMAERLSLSPRNWLTAVGVARLLRISLRRMSRSLAYECKHVLSSSKIRPYRRIV